MQVPRPCDVRGYLLCAQPPVMTSAPMWDLGCVGPISVGDGQQIFQVGIVNVPTICEPYQPRLCHGVRGGHAGFNHDHLRQHLVANGVCTCNETKAATMPKRKFDSIKLNQHRSKLRSNLPTKSAPHIKHLRPTSESSSSARLPMRHAFAKTTVPSTDALPNCKRRRFWIAKAFLYLDQKLNDFNDFDTATSFSQRTWLAKLRSEQTHTHTRHALLLATSEVRSLY